MLCLVVVGRRGSSSSCLACPRWRHHPYSLRGASAVDRLVDRLAASRPFVPSCLSGGGTVGGSCFLLFRASRCLGCRPLGSARLPWGRLVLSVCLLAASGSYGWGVAVGMAGRGCFSSVPRGSCGLPLRLMLSVGSAVLVAQLVVCLIAPCACLAACGGRGRLVLAFRLSSIRISPRPSCRGGGAIFLFCRFFPLFC